MAFEKAAHRRFSIRHLIAGLALSLGAFGAAQAGTGQKLYDKPVDGMDCTPVVVAGTPGTPAKKVGAAKELTAEQFAAAEAKYRKLTPRQRAAQDKAWRAVVAKRAAAAATLIPGTPGTPARSLYSCVHPQAPTPTPLIPGLTPDAPAERNYTPVPHQPVLPLFPWGTPGTPHNPPPGGGDPQDPCTSFRDLLTGPDGKWDDSKVQHAWQDMPGMSKKCDIPQPPTPPVTPPVPPVIHPPITPPVTPPPLDCRD